MGELKNIPYILIVTSKEEKGIVSSQIKNYFDDKKSHYVVIMDEDDYGKNVKWLGGLNNLINKLPSLKELRKKCDSGKQKKIKGYSRRINNAIKRFKPTAVVCPTTYGLLITLAANVDGCFNTQIVSLSTDFTLDKNTVDSKVDKYIVENEEIKDALISNGIPNTDVFTLGIPFSATPINQEEKTALKDKLGLRDVPTVFVCVNNGSENLEVLDMLFDQGDIINVVAYVDDKKLLNELRKKVEAKSCDNVQLFDKLNLYGDYLSVSDILITNYEAATVSKAFLLGKAVIAFAPKGEVQKNDVIYLEENKLIAYAKSSQDVIIKLYDVLQTELNVELVNNAKNRVKTGQLAEICEFLATLGAV